MQTNIIDPYNCKNVLFNADSSGSSYTLQLKQYMSMHKLKYPAGDGVVCSLGDSCLVHGLTVGQWDGVHRVNLVALNLFQEVLPWFKPALPAAVAQKASNHSRENAVIQLLRGVNT